MIGAETLKSFRFGDSRGTFGDIIMATFLVSLMPSWARKCENETRPGSVTHIAHLTHARDSENVNFQCSKWNICAKYKRRSHAVIHFFIHSM